MTNLRCRVQSCNWYNDEDLFFEHFEQHHRHLIREINEKENNFQLKFEDFQKDCLLLVGNNGLYWLINNHNSQTTDNFQSTIYAIGEFSLEETYYIKLGKIANDHTQIHGPYTTQRENSKKFDATINWTFLTELASKTTESNMWIFFGQYNLDEDENDVYTPCCININWNDEKEKEANQELLDIFTCGFCLEPIKENIRFCDNPIQTHYYCNICLDNMVKNKNKLRCYCKGYFLYDCQDSFLENILKMMKFE